MILIFSGCAPVAIQPQVRLSPEKTFDVVQVLHDKESNIRSAKGLFRASIEGSGIPIAHNFEGVVFYHHHDSVRLKGFTRVGGLVFDFIRNQDLYQLHIPANGHAHTGRITELSQSEDHGQLIRLSLRAMEAIFGKIDHVNPNNVSLYENESHLLLDAPLSEQKDFGFSEDLTMRLWLDRGTFDVVSVEYITEQGTVVMRVECEDFRNADFQPSLESSPIRLPFFVRAEDFKTTASVTLRFQELVANAE